MKTKYCSSCRSEKLLTEFHRYKNAKDESGRHNQCKVCKSAATKKYFSTPLGKKRRSEIGKKYHQSVRGQKKYREHYERWKITEKAKLSRRANMKRQMLRHPERIKARTAISHAIAEGKIPPAKKLQCVLCKKQAHEYHHHMGYAKKHHSDVIPVCKKCHSRRPGAVEKAFEYRE